MIWAIILAAGESKRMGEPKLLLPFGQKTIIETVVDHVMQSKADRILVILGHNEKKLREKIEGLPVTITVNTVYRQGMLSSVQRGFEDLPEDARAALIVLGDQPSIPISIIDSIVDAKDKTQKGIVIPTCKGRRGHPVLVDMKYREEVMRLDPDTGLRGLVHGHIEDVLEVEVDTAYILKDIDTAEDYTREINRGR